MNIICDVDKVIEIINEMADVIEKNKDYLTELDAKIGDADHGINMNRGFSAVRNKLPLVKDKCIGSILKEIGMVLVTTVGGASGPLYGTAFLYAGTHVIGKKTLCVKDLAGIFNLALNGLVKRGHAKVGDKTMVDTLSPVVDYLNSTQIEGKSTREVLNTAAVIAEQGMESTRPLIALRGRASFLRERSAGHLDPGAVSCYLLIKTIAMAFQGEV